MTLTDDIIILAMDPNGATMKYGEIVAQLESDTRMRRAELYRAVDRKLQRMKREGRVELVRGVGGGWRRVRP